MSDTSNIRDDLDSIKSWEKAYTEFDEVYMRFFKPKGFTRFESWLLWDTNNVKNVLHSIERVLKDKFGYLD